MIDLGSIAGLHEHGHQLAAYCSRCIIEINKESTHLTHTVTDIFIGQSAGEGIPQLVSELKRRKTTAG